MLIILKRSKVKSGKGMRYDAAWMLECLLLRIKSFAAYEQLRTNSILPLPHPNTLGKLVGAVSCHFGFNDFALKAIAKILLDKSPEELLGVVSIDEIVITADLDFHGHNFHGFCHLDPEPQLDGVYAAYTTDDGSEENQEERRDITIKDLADHALVIMFRPLLASWVQPIATFATRSAAPGDQLLRLLLMAIVKLTESGAHVLGFVCDGAQTNKSLWKLAGVGLYLEKGMEVVKNFMPHPTVDGQNIYFFLDPPHAFKCIRNYIYNNLIVQVAYIIYYKFTLQFFIITQITLFTGCWKCYLEAAYR